MSGTWSIKVYANPARPGILHPGRAAQLIACDRDHEESTKAGKHRFALHPRPATVSLPEGHVLCSHYARLVKDGDVFAADAGDNREVRRRQAHPDGPPRTARLEAREASGRGEGGGRGTREEARRGEGRRRAARERREEGRRRARGAREAPLGPRAEDAVRRGHEARDARGEGGRRARPHRARGRRQRAAAARGVIAWWRCSHVTAPFLRIERNRLGGLSECAARHDDARRHLAEWSSGSSSPS